MLSMPTSLLVSLLIYPLSTPVQSKRDVCSVHYLFFTAIFVLMDIYYIFTYSDTHVMCIPPARTLLYVWAFPWNVF